MELLHGCADCFILISRDNLEVSEELSLVELMLQHETDGEVKTDQHLLSSVELMLQQELIEKVKTDQHLLS